MKKTVITAFALTAILAACTGGNTIYVNEPSALQPFVELPEEGPTVTIDQTATSTETPASIGACDPSLALVNIGRPVSVLGTSGGLPANVRILKPNEPQTLDARSDRLTIYVDENNDIITAQCI